MTRARIYIAVLSASVALFSLSASVSAGASYSVSQISGEALAITDSGIILLGTALQNPDGTTVSPPIDSTQLFVGWALNSGRTVVGTGIWQGNSIAPLPILPLVMTPVAKRLPSMTIT